MVPPSVDSATTRVTHRLLLLDTEPNILIKIFGGKHILISFLILNQTEIFESIWSTETVSQRHVFWIPNNVVTVCFDSDIVIISINFSTGDDTWPAPQTGGKNCDNSSQRIKKEPGRETCLLFTLLISLLHLHFVREQNNSYSSQRGRSIFYLHYWFLSAKITPHQQSAIHLYLKNTHLTFFLQVVSDKGDDAEIRRWPLRGNALLQFLSWSLSDIKCDIYKYQHQVFIMSSTVHISILW